MMSIAQVIRMVGESTEAVGAGVGGGSSGQKMPTLEEYGTNLTKLAEEVLPLSPLCLLLVYVTIEDKKNLTIFSCRENWTQLLVDRIKSSV